MLAYKGMVGTCGSKIARRHSAHDADLAAKHSLIGSRRPFSIDPAGVGVGHLTLDHAVIAAGAADHDHRLHADGAERVAVIRRQIRPAARRALVILKRFA